MKTRNYGRLVDDQACRKEFKSPAGPKKAPHEAGLEVEYGRANNAVFLQVADNRQWRLIGT